VIHIPRLPFLISFTSSADKADLSLPSFYGIFGGFRFGKLLAMIIRLPYLMASCLRVEVGELLQEAKAAPT